MKFVLALVILIASCKGNTLNADEQLLRSLLNTIIQADNRGDITTVLSCYSGEAVLMPPGKLPISGINAIEESYKNIFTNSIVHLESTIDEIKIFPSYAVITGINTGSVVMKNDSSSSAVNDKFMMLLEKEANTWKIRKLIWNKNQ